MYPFVFNEAESRRLDAQVVAYQQSPEDDDLYRAVHHKTQQLLYLLPKRLHLLPEEECSPFLFFCWDAIDHYLSSFSIGRLSYQGYISQVVRQRARYFIFQQKQRLRKDRVLLRHQHYEISNPVEELIAAEDALPYCTLRAPTPAKEDLPTLFTQLLEQYHISPTALVEEHHRTLQKHFSQKTNRKRLLIVLALCPLAVEEHLLEEIALLLGVAPTSLSAYLRCAAVHLEKKRAAQKEFERISNRHFRRLLEIEGAMQRAADSAEVQELQQLRSRTAALYKKKVQQIRCLELSLSHRELGELLAIPKGTIDSSVYYIRQLLQGHVDEIERKGYS